MVMRRFLNIVIEAHVETVVLYLSLYDNLCVYKDYFPYKTSLQLTFWFCFLTVPFCTPPSQGVPCANAPMDAGNDAEMALHCLVQ